MTEAAREHTGAPTDTNAWFFEDTSLDDLLADTRPLVVIEDLALDDLTAEEARTFLQAVES